ncbi:hypothetical protein A3F45_01435 [Candidatus Curtissbacteria bacterium RIFCSPHIGHO2_12_FULL_41_17]|uniref:Glycosyl transferase n=2 Tax=Candidatus Curtissiibacteriota TaxID=1752717 RepID=A0A1F5HLJ2_9BACT|nr:MAG: hypothetical protein A2693_02050 [Candidatus Curtissbacteria bacterium RIFCSPHIGHO2_01_FULL_40_12]OGE04879.1 MAG: hypothetical protein A3F45_01435 [Candidatus Curtissbacteria bacterium RIFCSPHIGHO2_12_FULL_41_17]
MKKLKIAQIAPLVESVPPQKYGGTERVVYSLCEELVKRGHEVTLFASGDSKSSAKLISVYPVHLRAAKIPDLYGTNDLTMLNIGTAYSMQEEFDLIHDHCGSLSLASANICRKPMLMTMHGPFTSYNRRIFEKLTNPGIVTISKAQARLAPAINHLGTVYHGLSMESYPFGAKSGNYLLFVGRISMEKGVHLAIEVAQYLNLPLIIAAKLDSVDMAYFNEYVGPKLSDNLIKWVGEVDEGERNKLMKNALCFLHPITWEEPFGLTLIEAMACGCPVVAIGKGSVAEIVEDGKTGFVVSDVYEMIEAVKNIDKIRRYTCRKHVLSNFNSRRMADEYEKIYDKLMQAEELQKEYSFEEQSLFRAENSGIHAEDETNLEARKREPWPKECGNLFGQPLSLPSPGQQRFKIPLES